MTPEQRFLAKVRKTSTCWLWQGAVDSNNRYGRFWDGNRSVNAHRWAYEHWVGPIPAGLTIDHKCRTPLCVNPDPGHMEVVTLRENGLRSGRARAADTQNVLAAVLGLNERIDGVNERVDATLAGQQTLSKQMTDLHGCVTKLEETTNQRLHLMEADITTLKRPWLILASGWSKAVALSGFATAATATIVKLEAWRFLPF